jgi:hypothetical protein
MRSRIKFRKFKGPSYKKKIDPQNEDKGLTRATWWLVGVTGFLAFVSAGLAIFTAGLYRVAVKESASSDKHADTAYMFSKRQLGLAEKMFQSSDSTTKESMIIWENLVSAYNGNTKMLELQMEKGNRAYLIIDSIHFIFDDRTNKLTVDAWFSNHGKTPAIQVRKAARVVFLSDAVVDANRAAFDKTAREEQASLTQGAGTRRSFYHKVIDCTTKQYELILSGKKKFSLAGCILYQDVYGRPHFTHYCVYYLPSEGFTFCDTYNDYN